MDLLAPVIQALPQTWVIALVCAGFLVGGLGKGIMGVGMPVLMLAIVSQWLGIAQTLALLTLPMLMANIYQSLDGPALKEILTRLWAYYLAAVCGAVFGVWVLAGAAEENLRIGLGVLLVIYSVWSLIGMRPPAPSAGAERVLSPMMGGLGGMALGMLGTFIVPGVIYLQALRMPKDAFVQAMGVALLVSSGTVGVSLASHNILAFEELVLSLLCAPVAFFGVWAGRRLRDRLPEELFRKVFFLGLLAIGASAIWRHAV